MFGNCGAEEDVENLLASSEITLADLKLNSLLRKAPK